MQKVPFDFRSPSAKARPRTIRTLTVQEPDHLRGKGRTTEQIRDAPLGAIFVWCTFDTDYPKKLARELDRRDLLIWPRSILSNSDPLRGRRLKGIIVDHACLLTPDEHANLLVLQHQVR